MFLMPVRENQETEKQKILTVLKNMLSICTSPAATGISDGVRTIIVIIIIIIIIIISLFIEHLSCQW